MPSLEDAALAAIDLLRELPRERAEVARAKARFEELRRAHPGTPARLSVDLRPGWPYADYDVLLEHPAGGTVGVTWRADGGTPWVVEYAEHWAANLVVTVGDAYEGVSLQEALLILKLATGAQPDLMERIVEEKVVAMCIGEDPPEVTDAELQQAADTYRSAHGLTAPGSVAAKLTEWGITLERFEKMLRHAIQRRKLAERVASGQIEPYFEAHRDELARRRVVQVRTRARRVADALGEAARRGQGLAAAVATKANEPEAEGVELEIGRRFAGELPPGLATAGPGIVGPFAHGNGWCVAEVLAESPAELDDATRAEITRRIFRGHIAARRDAANVRWRWI